MTALVNTIKRQLDIPTWEFLRQAPAASSAVSCTCNADNSNFNVQQGRYIYYLISATGFWRYDTWMDSYEQLSSPPIATATWVSMRFATSQAIEGLVQAAGSSTVTIPGYFGKALKGYDIRINGGTGNGQRRIITDVADVVVADTGVPTAIANALGGISITDTTKNWAINQWVGYSVRITFGPGVGQVRKVLYNSATVLTLGDINKSAEFIWCNPMIYSPAISATAGSQSIYSIETSTLTVDTAWGTQPDATSTFRIESGVIFLVSSAASTPFYTLQQYDVVSDTWYIRTANNSNVAVVGTDGTLERTGDSATYWDRGSANGTNTTTTLQDLNKNWTVNQWAGYYVRIWSGTAENQVRQVVSNTANTLTWTTAGTTPDATSQYFLEGFDGGTATSGTTTSLTDSTKSWTTNRWANYSLRITSGTGKGQSSPILSNTGTVLTLVKTFATAPDSTTTYTISGDGDKLYMLLGANAAMLALNLDDDLGTYGRWAESGAARQGTVTYSSNQRAIALSTITFVTTTATATTVNPHGLKTGYSVVIAGATGADASKYNGTFTITVTGANTFTYTMGSTPAGNATFTGHSTTTLTDGSKNWTTNQWAGYLCNVTTAQVTAATGAATCQTMQIASNTATTLTLVAAITAPSNGISRFVISQRPALGALDSGIATGAQSTTTLQDTTKVGVTAATSTISGTTLTIVTVSSGGFFPYQGITGTGVTAGTIILSQLTGTPNGAGTYQVSISQTVSATAITSGWVVNFWAGRKVKFTGGTGQSQDLTITSNTNNTLTFGVATAPVAGATTYSILATPVRGTGMELNWAFGTSDANMRGKFLHVARGGAALGFDRYNLTTDQWDLMPITPQIETLTSGSMYAYDGQDRYYFTKEVTQRVYYLDVVTNTIHGAGQYPYAAGTAIIGNRMEVFQTVDGIKYLWLQRHSQLEAFRTILIQ